MRTRRRPPLHPGESLKLYYLEPLNLLQQNFNLWHAARQSDAWPAVRELVMAV